MLYRLKQFSESIDRAAKVFAQVALGMIVLLVLCEVVARNVVGRSITWMEEVAITYIGTWLVFIGASHAMKAGMLISLRIVLDRLDRRLAAAATAVTQCAVLAFLAVIVVYGIQLSTSAMGQPSPALQLPMGLAYLGIVVGCSMMMVHVVSSIAESLGEHE